MLKLDDTIDLNGAVEGELSDAQSSAGVLANSLAEDGDEDVGGGVGDDGGEAKGGVGVDKNVDLNNAGNLLEVTVAGSLQLRDEVDDAHLRGLACLLKVDGALHVALLGDGAGDEVLGLGAGDLSGDVDLIVGDDIGDVVGEGDGGDGDDEAKGRNTLLNGGHGCGVVVVGNWGWFVKICSSGSENERA